MQDQLRVLAQLQLLAKQKLAFTSQKDKLNADEVRQLWQDIRLLTQNIASDKEKLLGFGKVCVRQEADLLALTKHCQQMEAKLYGGEITNLKEMEQVKSQCETARLNISALEDEIFASIDSQEKLTAQIGQREELLRQKKLLHSELQQKIAVEGARLDAEKALLEAEFDRLAGGVDPGLLAKFRDMGRNMAAPVAKVENGICGGCRRSVPTRQVALGVSILIYCDNCGRMLLVE